MYVHISAGSNTGVIHKITDPVTAQSLYPDILYHHTLPEVAVTDSDLYRLAGEMMKEHGTGGCAFLQQNDSCKDEVYETLTALAQSLTDYEPSVSRTEGLPAEEACAIQNMAVLLQLSATMQRSFLQLMTYYYEMGGRAENIFTPLQQEYILPVRTKNEGKMIYEHIRNIILG